VFNDSLHIYMYKCMRVNFYFRLKLLADNLEVVLWSEKIEIKLNIKHTT